MPDTVRHALSCAVRFEDHFTGEPVGDELPVRLAGSFQRPITRPGGAGRRQDDGAYRFVDAPSGTTRILWREPFARSHADWTRWDDDPEIVLPLADPTALVAVELWRTSNAAAPASATGVRGRLIGPNPAGQTIRIALQAAPFDRFTRSDDAGDFLFLPPGRLPTNAQGRVPLTIDVHDPGGVVRAVNGGTFVPPSAGAVFPAADFEILPRTVPRVLFQIA
jgi:hypothetical protein